MQIKFEHLIRHVVIGMVTDHYSSALFSIQLVTYVYLA
jgi:hypothetical protein